MKISITKENTTPSGLDTEIRNIKKLSSKFRLLSVFILTMMRKHISRMKKNNIISNPDTAQSMSGRLKSMSIAAGIKKSDKPVSVQIL